jgi:hypothetical protein
MRPVVVSAGPVGTTAANNISLSQTPGAAGNLTLNGSLVTGGVAMLPNPQRVKITTTDTTHAFTLTGTTPTGTLVTETLTNAGSSITSALDYMTITSIAINGAATGAVTVGNGGSPLAATPWVRLDEYSPGTVSIQVNVTGTVSFTVQSSNDGNMDSPTGTPSSYVWITTNDTNAVAATASLQTNFLIVPIWGRVLLNSGSGSIKAIFVQSGAAPY